MGGNQDEVNEQIKNEVSLTTKLSVNGRENSINVLRQGWLDDERYYLDTELCLLKLEDYIRLDFKSVVGTPKYFDPQPLEDNPECLSMWGITKQIVGGL